MSRAGESLIFYWWLTRTHCYIFRLKLCYGSASLRFEIILCLSLQAFRRAREQRTAREWPLASNPRHIRGGAKRDLLRFTRSCQVVAISRSSASAILLSRLVCLEWNQLPFLNACSTLWIDSRFVLSYQFSPLLFFHHLNFN